MTRIYDPDAYHNNVFSVGPVFTSAAHSSVDSGTSSVVILAANASRKGALIRNSDANALYLDLTAGTASANRSQITLAQFGYTTLPTGFVGAVTGIWAGNGSGTASIVEFT